MFDISKALAAGYSLRVNCVEEGDVLAPWSATADETAAAIESVEACAIYVRRDGVRLGVIFYAGDEVVDYTYRREICALVGDRYEGA